MRVPEATIGQVTPQAAPANVSNVRVSANDLGGQIGTSLTNIGDVLHKRALEMQKVEETAAAKETDVAFSNDLRSLLNDPDSGYLNLRGRVAYEQHDDVGKQIRDLKTQHIAGMNVAANRPRVALFEAQADRRINGALNSISWHASKQLRQWQDDAYESRKESSIDDAVLNSNDSDAIRRSVQIGLAEITDASKRNSWSPEEHAQQVQAYTTKFHTSVIDRLANEDIAHADQYYQENIDEIDPTSRAKIEEQFQEIEDHAIEKIASDLELSVYSGEASVVDVDAAFEEEIITGAKRTQLIKEIKQRADKAVAGKNRETLITSGLPLDPKNKDHRLAVEEAFTRLGGSSPVALSLAKQTGLLPKQVQSIFRSTARTGTGPKVDQVLELYNAVDDQVPLALDDVSDKDVAVLDNASELVRGGLSAHEALEISRTQANLPESERKVIKERYKEEAAENAEWLQDSLNSDDAYDTELFSDAPTPPAAMTADYERLAESFYIHTGGDIDRARELAWKTLKRSWTRTDINGDGELMRYSPEFDLGVSTKILRKDLDTQLEEIKVKPESVKVVSDVITARSKRGQRSYAVIKVRPDGLPEILRGPNNMPLRWVPEPMPILQKQQNDALSRARKARQQHQQVERVRQHFPNGG
ncbi:MAG: hypothetical protein KZQ98_17770 [Candidatus Thiodiazotropha sp. (ex Lucinoma borealis)]|nr:hypothetical protein [Candidatus Thiodiazotropha sp. (ex Lucinoma borealis)]